MDTGQGAGNPEFESRKAERKCERPKTRVTYHDGARTSQGAVTGSERAEEREGGKTKDVKWRSGNIERSAQHSRKA